MENKEIPSGEKLYAFQVALKATPLWNSLDIAKRVDFIIAEIPDLMDVLEAVFMVSAQLWGSVRYNDDKRQDDTLMLQLPTKEDFIHKLIIEGAENIYYDPYLYDHRVSKSKRRDNRTEVSKIVDDSCRKCLDKCFPRNEILKKYISQKRDELNGKNIKDTDIQSDSDNNSDSGGEYNDDEAVGEDSDDEDKPAVIHDSSSDSENDSEEEDRVIQINDDKLSSQQKFNMQSNEPLPPPPNEGEAPVFNTEPRNTPPFHQNDQEPSSPTQDVTYQIQD